MSVMAQDSVMLTTKELADELKVTPQTLSQWAKQGKVPAYKAGRDLGASTATRFLVRSGLLRSRSNGGNRLVRVSIDAGYPSRTANECAN